MLRSREFFAAVKFVKALALEGWRAKDKKMMNAGIDPAGLTDSDRTLSSLGGSDDSRETDSTSGSDDQAVKEPPAKKEDSSVREVARVGSEGGGGGALSGAEESSTVKQPKLASLQSGVPGEEEEHRFKSRGGGQDKSDTSPERPRTPAVHVLKNGDDDLFAGMDDPVGSAV